MAKLYAVDVSRLVKVMNPATVPCPFCREMAIEGNAEYNTVFLSKLNKRLDVDDAEAYLMMSTFYLTGNEEMGIPQNVDKGMEMLKKSADLGCSTAHCKLGDIYKGYDGINVAVDLKKSKQHYELGAIGGNIQARNNLAYIEFKTPNEERAVKHYMISARAGSRLALANLRKFLMDIGSRYITWEQYEEIERECMDAVDEMKSGQRDFAAFLEDEPN